MKTIEINLYSFNELSDKAKEKAMNKYYENEDFYYIWDDAHKTVKEFCDKTIIKTYQNSWLDPYFNHIDDSILNLTGIRLLKYFINNFDFLFKRKYLKCFDGHKNHKMITNKTVQSKGKSNGKKYCFATSNIQKETSCNLTGVYYDDDFLEPIYNFIKNPKDNKNFEDIICECFYSLKNSIESEIEAKQTIEGFSELCEMNGYCFTEDGTME